MNAVDRLRRAVLRWDRLITAAVLGLPFILTLLFGFLWLVEHGWLLWFVGLSAMAGAGVFLARHLARRYSVRKAGQGEPAPEPELSVEADPDWLPREKEVFEQVRRHIESLTGEVQPWESLPELAYDVVNQVAAGFGDTGRGALHFTLPEALLLIERSASRYRDYLRARLPFSDQISLATLHWFWRHRDRATLLWKLADGGRRVARFAINPSAGILREIEQLIAGGNSSYLTDQMLGALQGVLLEEVAYAAVELYSGRLRFSDAELLELQLAATEADRERLAQPDAPLRILFAGQVSSGKSTLINALLEEDRTETDTAPTTDALVVYECQLDEMPCLLVDSRGLDGSSAGRDALLEEMVRADMVVWAIRADRPARAPDLDLKGRFDAWFEQRPQRRKPEIIAVATCMDRLAERWPLPEHGLDEGLRQRFSDAVQAIERDLRGLKPHPVSSLPPEWNLEVVVGAMEAHLGEAMLVQRNRLRVQGGQEGGLLHEARKSARGVWHGTRVLGGRLARRSLGGRPPD